MPLMVGLSEEERRELLRAARDYAVSLGNAETNDAIKSESEKAERASAFALFQSLVEELEAGASVSAVSAKKACAYILEAKVDFMQEDTPSKRTNYGEVAATVRHRAISARAAALSAGRG